MSLVRRAAPVALMVAGLAVLGLAWGAREAALAGWRVARVQEAEELAGFVRGATAARNDLLVVERFVALARRDEVAWALVLDANGRAVFHSHGADVGTIYDSAVAKAALAATTTAVQDLAGLGVTEVDVPLGAGRVLRLGCTPRAVAAADPFLWGGAGLAALVLAGAGLLAARRG